MIIQLSSGQGPTECELAVKNYSIPCVKNTRTSSCFPAMLPKHPNATVLFYFPRNVIYPTWKAVFNGFVKVLTGQITNEKTGS